MKPVEMTDELRAAAISGLEADIRRKQELLDSLRGTTGVKRGRPSKTALHIERTWHARQNGNGNGHANGNGNGNGHAPTADVSVRGLGPGDAILKTIMVRGAMTKKELVAFLTPKKFKKTAIASALTRLHTVSHALERADDKARDSAWRLAKIGTDIAAQLPGA